MPAQRRHRRVALPAVGWLFVGMAATAVVVAVGILGAAGELGAAPDGLLDPGPLVRFGLPVARTIHDLTASLTIGLLLLAVWGVAPENGSAADSFTGARLAMLRAASATVGAWLLSAVTVLLLTVSDVAGVPVQSPTFAPTVRAFASQVELGRALWSSLLLVAAVAVITVLSSRLQTAGCAALVALLALLPLALTGHTSGSNDHQNSASSLALHLVGVAVWVGGLGALVLMARRLGAQLPAVVRRYSTLAGWCFALVALSGVVNAALRLGSFSRLTSLYGLLALAKLVALGLLGLAGWRHRVAILPRLDSGNGRRAFLRLAAVELLVMGATMGLAVALSRSAAPAAVHAVAQTRAELLGFDPPALTLTSYLTQVYPDILWLLAGLAALGWYVRAVLTLGRQGGRWPLHRSVAFVAGCLALTLVTSGGPAVYSRLSFSAHMLQHLGLMLLVPLLLVLGAPLTLALRTLPVRPDRSVGLRETVELLLSSRALGYLRDPVAAAGLLVGGFIAFYYATGAFQLALFTHTGHVLMTVYFLATGSLFAWVVLGSGPQQARRADPLPVRLLTLALASAILAVFGITVQRSSSVLAERWWDALGQVDQAALLQDQQVGGGLVALSGAVLLALAAVAFAVQARRRRSAAPGTAPRSTPVTEPMLVGDAGTVAAAPADRGTPRP